MTTTRITISNSGTAAFPIWQVWAEPEDENGYCIEHECEMLANFVTLKEAKLFASNIEHQPA